MEVSDRALEEFLDEALSRFFQNDASTIFAGVSERSNCTMLATHMSRLIEEYGFVGYHADTEYNRNGAQVKTIINGREEVLEITCDLILHSRGTLAADNLIAVEMKKVSRPKAEREKDRERLMALTKPVEDVYSWNGSRPVHVCGYKLGIFLLLDPIRGQCTVEYFKMGEQVHTQVLEIPGQERQH